jgi:hypothetical protein
MSGLLAHGGANFMAVHSTGPQLNEEKQSGARKWFSKLPVQPGPDYSIYFNDFLVAQNYAASDWVVTETDAGATEAIAADVVGGALLLTNTATDDDIVQIQSAEEFLKLTSGKRLWLEARFKVSDATQSDLFVGLATTDTTIMAGTTDACGFRKADASTTLVSLTEDNTSETTNTLVTMADDTYVQVGFYWDGKNKVEFYSGRSLVSTHTSNIEQTNKLALTFCLQNGEGVAKTMTIDYIYVCQER